jgi:hypothetical protein
MYAVVTVVFGVCNSDCGSYFSYVLWVSNKSDYQSKARL